MALLAPDRQPVISMPVAISAARDTYCPQSNTGLRPAPVSQLASATSH
jgi:hypothetical protein